MEIIKPRQTIETERYFTTWDQADGHGGWSFDCDADGVPSFPCPEAEANYALAQREGVNHRVEVRRNSYTSPAVGMCDCGGLVTLDSFTCHCDKCDRLYNSFGQLLAPVECWGEETGEHWADILNAENIPDDDYYGRGE